MHIDVDLSGKVAVVTGGGRGIGRAIALAYGRAGASVIVAARTVAEITSVADEIVAAGGDALPVGVDVADPDAVRDCVATTLEARGRIDLVVANAGVGGFGDEGDRVEAFRRVVDVNLVGVYALVDAARDALCRQGGKIIVMGSGAGYRPFPGGAAYSASKAALAMLVRVLAVELRAHDVAVNEIVPGPVRTELASTAVDRSLLPSAVASEWFKEPDDVVDLALFLAGQPDHGPTGQRFSLLGRDG